ncbi:MAG: hypothetical protein ABIS39_02090 [Sphingomicrobium sp.]
MSSAFLLSPSTRSARAHEWNAGKAVTFIVTLAATRTVTLAARAAGMSRKSAYALRERDSAFAAAWQAAIGRPKDDKVDEVENPPVPLSRGNTGERAAASTSSIGLSPTTRAIDALRRDRFFARLAGLHGAAGNLAPNPPIP